MARAVRRKKPLPRIRVTRGLTVGSKLKCADNSGAKLLQIIGVKGYRGRKGRYPSAGVGDLVTVTVKAGKPDLVHTVQRAVIIRQRKPFKRRNGISVSFEDNAAILLTGENTPKGTEIKGPVAKEVLKRIPKLAGVTSMVV